MDLKRNGSGYYDPTAYEALKNYEKEVERMSIKRGEIYVIELPNGKTVNGLIVSSDKRNEGDWLNAIVLNEKPKGACPVAIKCGVMQYADCDRITFVGSRSIFDFIRIATDAEMQEIDRALMDSLGLTIEAPEQPIRSLDSEYLAKIDDLTMKLEGAERKLDEEKTQYQKLLCEYTCTREKLDELDAENSKILRDCVDLQVKLVKAEKEIPVFPEEIQKTLLKAETQRDMYKELYEQMLEKMIG